MNKDIDKSKKIAKHLVNIMLEKKSLYKEEFDEWLNNNPTAIEIVEKLSDEDKFSDSYKLFLKKKAEDGAKELFNKIERKQRQRRLTIITSAAAILFISLLIWKLPLNDNQKLAIYDKQNNSVIKSKKTASVELILEGGKIVCLDDVDTVKTNHGLIQKLTTAEILMPSDKKTDCTTAEILNLKLGAKRTYTIRLSDGTKVILNSKSALTFPDKFIGETREVTLQGEAFFDVAKDAERPFIVRANNVDIQVHGTKFTVNNHDSSNIVSYLQEGAIGVNINGTEPKLLKPNQAIKINTDKGTTIIENVYNADRYIAWMNNYFYFDAASAENVIENLSIWYDVELKIIKETTVEPQITGIFSRDLELKDIIESIEKVTNIKIKIIHMK